MERTKNLERYALGLLYPALIIDLVFMPYFGFLLVVAMIIAIAISLKDGRRWCADGCPRGIFFDEYLSKISLNKPIPLFFKSWVLKLFWVCILFFVLGLRLVQSHGNLLLIGQAFGIVLIMTTIIALPLGIVFNSRIFCTFCPMGSVCGWIGRNKGKLKIERDKCTACKTCMKNCPMEIDAGAYKSDGIVNSLNCINCKKCIKNCPPKAISK